MYLKLLHRLTTFFFGKTKQSGFTAAGLTAALFTALFFVNLLFTAAAAETGSESDMVALSRSINEDITLEGDKTYLVQGTVTIENGVSVDIEPGAVLKGSRFDVSSSYSEEGVLIVKGRLEARGTADNPIYFTDGEDESPDVGSGFAESGGWEGIIVNEGEAILEHAEIRSVRGLEPGILVGIRGNLTATSCNFRWNKTAIHINGGKALLEGSVFFLEEPEHATGIAVSSLSENVIIRDNFFQGSHAHLSSGIIIIPEGSLEEPLLDIVFNTFYKTGRGVKLKNGGHILKGNNFQENISNGVELETDPLPTLPSDVRYNFWNSPDGPSRNVNGGSEGSGDRISHTELLDYEPWSEHPFLFCSSPLDVTITSPQAGAELYENALLEAYVECPNLKEVIFYLDEIEMERFTAAGSKIFSYHLPAGELEKEHSFTAASVSLLGEQAESTIAFKLSPAAAAEPGNGSEESGENGDEGPGDTPGENPPVDNGEESGATEPGEGNKDGHEKSPPPDDIDKDAEKDTEQSPRNKRPQQADNTPEKESIPSEEDCEKEDMHLIIDKKDEKESAETDDTIFFAVFKDVDEKHPAAEAVYFLYQKGLIKGMGDMIFAPEEKLTRAQAAALLIRALPKTENMRSDGLIDVSKDAWYFEYVQKALKAGIFKGYENGLFKPLQAITGAEYAAIIDRLGSYTARDNRQTGSAKTETPLYEEIYVNIKSRQVIDQTPCWAKNSVDNLIKKEIIVLEKMPWFDPNNSINRGEGAEILYRALVHYGF